MDFVCLIFYEHFLFLFKILSQNHLSTFNFTVIDSLTSEYNCGTYFWIYQGLPYPRGLEIEGVQGSSQSDDHRRNVSYIAVPKGSHAGHSFHINFSLNTLERRSGKPFVMEEGHAERRNHFICCLFCCFHISLSNLKFSYRYETSGKLWFWHRWHLHSSVEKHADQLQKGGWLLSAQDTRRAIWVIATFCLRINQMKTLGCAFTWRNLAGMALVMELLGLCTFNFWASDWLTSNFSIHSLPTHFMHTQALLCTENDKREIAGI
jgi:hypothetical protein